MVKVLLKASQTSTIPSIEDICACRPNDIQAVYHDTHRLGQKCDNFVSRVLYLIIVRYKHNRQTPNCQKDDSWNVILPNSLLLEDIDGK